MSNFVHNKAVLVQLVCVTLFSIVFIRCSFRGIGCCACKTFLRIPFKMTGRTINKISAKIQSVRLSEKFIYIDNGYSKQGSETITPFSFCLLSNGRDIRDKNYGMHYLTHLTFSTKRSSLWFTRNVKFCSNLRDFVH